MNNLLLFVDFQYIFDPKGNWPVPKFWDALTNALKVYNLLKCETIATRYIPPDPVFGEWISYFKQFHNVPVNPENQQYNIVKTIVSEECTIVSAPKFGKWPVILKTLKSLKMAMPKTLIILWATSPRVRTFALR